MDYCRKTTGVVEMNWDPITRIVGSLGIYTKIDFKQKKVIECYSTSSIFRGYSIFMKGKDPRERALHHQPESAVICGDNHANGARSTTRTWPMGLRPPHLAEWIINLGEAAEYMFDHNIFQENLVGVDLFCARMVGENQPRRAGTGQPHRGAARGRSRLQVHRRHHAVP